MSASGIAASISLARLHEGKVLPTVPNTCRQSPRTAPAQDGYVAAAVGTLMRID